MACRNDGSPWSAVEALTIIEQDEEGVSAKFTSALIKFAYILLRIFKRENGKDALQLVDLLADTTFKVNVLKRYIKSLADSKDFTTRITIELMKNNGFHGAVESGNRAKKDGCGTLQMNEVSEVRRVQVELFGKDDIMFHPER